MGVKEAWINVIFFKITGIEWSFDKHLLIWIIWKLEKGNKYALSLIAFLFWIVQMILKYFEIDFSILRKHFAKKDCKIAQRDSQISSVFFKINI